MEQRGIRFPVVEADESYAKGQCPADKTDELVAHLNEYRGHRQKDLILQYGAAYSTMADIRILPPWRGVVVMSNFKGSQVEKVAEGRVRAWKHKK